MDAFAAKDSISCPTGEISAYIDGELSPAEEMQLELHLAGCRDCVNDLNAQKQFLRALDMSLEDADGIALPENFTRTVVTAAESRVSGLRKGNERRNAMIICSVLFLISIFAVGRDLPGLVSAGGIAVEKFAAVVTFAGHLVFDIALSVAVVFRSLASRFVFDSTAGVAMLAIVFAFAFVVFSRLMTRRREV